MSLPTSSRILNRFARMSTASSRPVTVSISLTVSGSTFHTVLSRDATAIGADVTFRAFGPVASKENTRAPEAARLGLINEAVPADELDAAVDAVVADLLQGGPAALAASKRLLAEVPSMGLDEAFAWTQELSAELFAGPEAAEGMAAYLEKRPAPWIPTADTPEL